MFDIINIQLRQTSCNIINQNITSANNTELIRSKTFLIIIHHIRNPVHCYRSLTTSCHPLHDHIMKRTGANDLILFLLDRSNNITQYNIPVLTQVLHQQFIISRHITVIKTLQLTVFYIIGAFQIQINTITAAIRYLITSFPQFILIIYSSNGSSPIYNDHMCFILLYTMLANIDGFCQMFIQILIINSPKKGLLICRLIMTELISAVFLQTLRSKHLIIQFHIATLYCLDQCLGLLMSLLHLFLIHMNILCDLFAAFL